MIIEGTVTFGQDLSELSIASDFEGHYCRDKYGAALKDRNVKSGDTLAFYAEADDSVVKVTIILHGIYNNAPKEKTEDIVDKGHISFP
jgi:hypothetical protein